MNIGVRRGRVASIYATNDSSDLPLWVRLPTEGECGVRAVTLFWEGGDLSTSIVGLSSSLISTRLRMQYARQDRFRQVSTVVSPI